MTTFVRSYKQSLTNAWYSKRKVSFDWIVEKRQWLLFRDFHIVDFPFFRLLCTRHGCFWLLLLGFFLLSLSLL